ncbi:MAG: type II toxin-antitoxin system CcdA family antitoxin [Mangrovicoccus sp.]
MVPLEKRNTSISLSAANLDEANRLGLNISGIADAALERAVLEARRQNWLEENAEAFAAQSKWHEENGHPLAEIMAIGEDSGWKA